jgi:hypothetical protein
MYDVAKRPAFHMLQGLNNLKKPELTTTEVCKQAMAALPELSNEQLAALYIACEVEHTNRMAKAAGYQDDKEYNVQW